jgi:hypothetical protein
MKLSVRTTSLPALNNQNQRNDTQHNNNKYNQTKYKDNQPTRTQQPEH